MEIFNPIRELDSEVIIESITKENGKTWKIRGITLQAEVVNKNNRRYPLIILNEAINNHIKKNLETGGCLGELNHPEINSSSIDLKNVSHKFISVENKDNNFITESEVLNTPSGKIVQSLLEGGVKLGISSRALGKVETVKGINEIKALQIVSLGDIVSDPSGPNCYIEGILESISYQLNNGRFEKCEIDTNIDKYHKILKESSKADLNVAASKVIKSFLNFLNK